MISKMDFPTKKIEKQLIQNGHKFIYAVDEVGMGSLAGPVVVCAVEFKSRFFKKNHSNLALLRDSKLLSYKQREYFSGQLLKLPNMKFSICYSYPKTIDKLNIYKAARLAMKRAVLKFGNKGIVLVDGPHKIHGLNMEQVPITKGDRKVFAIACASILAKVYRDKMMKKYASKYPGYGFEIHKGYGTKYHIAKLASLGPSEIHRRSFNPVGKLV